MCVHVGIKYILISQKKNQNQQNKTIAKQKIQCGSK